MKDSESIQYMLDNVQKFSLGDIVCEMRTHINLMFTKGGATINELQTLSSMCISYLVKTQFEEGLEGDINFLIELLEALKKKQDETLGISELKSILSRKKDDE